MQIIPAIDLQKGKCVRLFKGIQEKSTIYSEDPLEMLYYWENLGAEVIHIIDLDGAFGEKSNLPLIKRMLEAATARIEVGGGIRSIEGAVELYSLGVERVIIGTAAVQDYSLVSSLAAEIGSQHLIIALDYRAEKVLTNGWKKSTDLNVYQVGKVMEEKGAGWILFSSAESDGTLEGPDIPNITRMTNSVTIPVIAAGGISSLEDIKKVILTNAAGLVVGKALYEKKFSYSEALQLVVTLEKNE
ncbi:MAG: 1-(5-phosphoribosyl)-5-[(5-phosphoribosylamino)methylideneamino]imidazole-4-carboxamide isomerase [Candidatus Helarchaeota archaeon]|nr:1-(5-phosphoribosyl)-5-[(5-phosphoribosylamino)methylideneamino]imidazole-4-carboxamide isomerase [Candidatus Helarchaeota archaeon]